MTHNEDDYQVGAGMDYNWQKEASEKWEANGRRGIIKAVPGAGKTRTGLLIALKVVQENPSAIVTILAPTNQIIEQWKKEMQEFSNILITTYFSGAKLAEEGYETDLLILDECHSILSPERRKALGIKHKWILGLSATPLESDELIGKVFIDIGWEDANIAPFNVEYKYFPITPEQKNMYRMFTEDIKKGYRMVNERLLREKDIMPIIMRRRGWVYELPQRVSLAVELVRSHPSDRIMIFSERLSQCNLVYRRLKDLHFSPSIYTSEADTLSLYKEGKSRILVTSKMVKEGYNDPETNVGIIMSTPLTERNHVQTVGRIIRYLPGKFAKVFVFLAEGTTDENMGKIQKKFVCPGTEYSVDSNYKVYKKVGPGRHYAREDGVHRVLSELFRHRRKTGRFWIKDGFVSIKNLNGEFEQIGVCPGEIEFEFHEPYDIHKKWTAKDDEEFLNRMKGEDA